MRCHHHRSPNPVCLEPRRAADSGGTPSQNDPASAHARSGSRPPAGLGGTLPAHHVSVAASSAQSSKIMAAETLTARASGDERATVTSKPASALAWKARILRVPERLGLLWWSGPLTALGRTLRKKGQNRGTYRTLVQLAQLP
jgi:hypothetical protein